MAPQLVRLAALIALLGFIGDVSAGQRVEALIAELAEQMDLTLNKMSKTIDQLSRQLMLQQLFVEERIRSDGGSGLKQSRQSTQGTLPYHANTVTGGRIAAIHEHANHIRTIGMGEFVAVLNGVEFRTRHNDYKLVQPQTRDTGTDKIAYNAVKEIPFPEVPPEVTQQGSVDKQIEEMREWFKAWRDQDYSVRDYRKYFKPVLCYLEGAWTLSDGKTLDESFDSDRHFIDAKSWHDLQDKVRFTSYTGRKDSAENFAYLPTTIMSTGNGTTQLAQWNYRIVCHPLKRDLSTKRMILIDDITSRISFGRTMEQHGESRAARYRVAPQDKDDWREGIVKGDLLDDLMAEIPGADGYGNKLFDEGIDGQLAMNFKTPGNLPAGYYHRWFKAQKDAMGSQSQHRAYSDENLFMARTTQDKIASMSVEKCTGRRKNKRCYSHSQKWTYAIPLELIYMTPLYSWNPYNIEYKGFHKAGPGLTVTDGGRLTGRSEPLALNGTNQNFYYRTPVNFFQPLGKSNDAADTAGKALWVNDPNGVARHVVATGTRIHLPGIDGVGKLRTRFPVMPLHYEGSPAWKELTALKDVVLQPNRYRHMLYTVDSGTEEPTTVTFQMRTSKSKNVEPHEHFIYVDLKDLEDLAKNPGKTMTVTTEEANGHTHFLTLTANGGKFRYIKCGSETRCWDGHPVTLNMVED